MAKKNRYLKKQEQYFKRTGKSKIAAARTPEGTRIKANSYIVVNPAFDINVVYTLLGVHNKVNAGMIIRGTEADFKDNPNEVYRVVNEEKILEIKTAKDGGGKDDEEQV